LTACSSCACQTFSYSSVGVREASRRVGIKIFDGVSRCNRSAATGSARLPSRELIPTDRGVCIRQVDYTGRPESVPVHRPQICGLDDKWTAAGLERHQQPTSFSITAPASSYHGNARDRRPCVMVDKSYTCTKTRPEQRASAYTRVTNRQTARIKLTRNRRNAGPKVPPFGNVRTHVQTGRKHNCCYY